jgi:hypothetical protein
MHIGCGSTAYSVGTVYGGKGHLYTPGVCPALLATSEFIYRCREFPYFSYIEPGANEE